MTEFTADPDEEGQDMFTAIDLDSNTDFKFKNMTTLRKRFGGDTYSVRRHRSLAPDERIVWIIAHDAGGGFSVPARLRVPVEAIGEQSEARRPVGRPSQGVQMYSTRLPTDLLDKLTAIAARDEITKTAAIRAALSEWIERNQ